MRRIALCAVLLVAGCGGGSKPAATVERAATTCVPPTVHRTQYPGHAPGLEKLPWIAGRPASTGLVGLLWYWPREWSDVRDARIFTRGTALHGASTKILWIFTARATQKTADSLLTVTGGRMDGPGKFQDEFSGVGYEGQAGAPSYASIIEVPTPGCWRLTLKSGSVTATVDMLAVRR